MLSSWACDCLSSPRVVILNEYMCWLSEIDIDIRYMYRTCIAYGLHKGLAWLSSMPSSGPIARESERLRHTDTNLLPLSHSLLEQCNNIRSYLEQFLARFCNLLQNCQRENDVTQMKCNSNKRGRHMGEQAGEGRCANCFNLQFRVATWAWRCKAGNFHFRFYLHCKPKANSKCRRRRRDTRIPRRKEKNFFWVTLVGGQKEKERETTTEFREKGEPKKGHMCPVRPDKVCAICAALRCV